jgi:hypothetical protein
VAVFLKPFEQHQTILFLFIVQIFPIALSKISGGKSSLKFGDENIYEQREMMFASPRLFACGYTRAMRFLLTLGILLFSAMQVRAHPEDELCVPGRDNIDPVVCAMLAEMNRSNGDFLLEENLYQIENIATKASSISIISTYIAIGMDHILLGGYDHMLFVIALFLASLRLGSLVWQISAFTIAHTITLALAASGTIKVSGDIIEPLIAFTIAFVAIENLFVRDITKWRPLIVMIFGLIHGLGFAAFISEFDLSETHFWSALIGFNIGVEVGQIGVVALVAGPVLAVRLALKDKFNTSKYRSWFTRPGSALIGLIGLWWGISRALSI